MGNKISAKKFAFESGLPIVPGSDEGISNTPHEQAEKIGYPLIIKAASGGGGRGMRMVEKESDFENAYNSAQSESKIAFSNRLK